MEENQLGTGREEYKTRKGSFTADLPRQKSERARTGFSKQKVQRTKAGNDHEDSPRNLQVPGIEEHFPQQEKGAT